MPHRHRMRILSSLHLNRNRRLTMRRIGVGVGAATIVGLVLFHLWLFVDRLKDLSILQPAVAAQWIATLLLLASLAYLRQRGVSLLKGRSALAFWLLVLVLHLMPGGTAAPAIETNYELLLELPTTWLGITIAIWLAVLLAVLLASLVVGQPNSGWRPGSRSQRTARQLGLGKLFRIRPPPLASPAS